MTLNKSDALEAVRTCLAAKATEQTRLDRIDVAVKPLPEGTYRVPVPDGGPTDAFIAAAQRAETPYLALALNTFGQVMKVDGIYQPSAPERSNLWKHWQRNRMDARQTGIHHSALKYGAAYGVALPGDPSPVIELLSPRRMTALYADPVSDEFPMLALDVNGALMRLFDETGVYYVGFENDLRSALGGPAVNANGALKFIEYRAHDLGVVPVVRYREQMLLDGEEQYGIVEPLLALDDRIRETNYEQLVAQYMAAFKQRIIVGWEAKDEAERLKASVASIWTFADENVKVFNLEATDIAPYLAARAANVRDFAAVAQLPAQSLGVDGISNISAEALAALEASKDRRSSEMQTSLGESHEQLFRLVALADGDTAGADDYDSEVRWQDFTARSYAQTVDGLTKIATMLDVPLELAWEGIPGWSNGQVSRAKTLLANGALTASDVARANAAQSPPVAKA